MITATTHPMPALRYAADALQPAISAATLDYHYGKHLRTYIDNLNRLVQGSPYEESSIEEIVRNAPEGALLNNAGQVINHTLYFEQFGPAPKEGEVNLPKGKILRYIERDFGSFGNLRRKMNEASAQLFGSGWVWLAQDDGGKLVLVSQPNGGNPVRMGMTPLLGFDVWEHAYYLDCQNRRAEHIDRLWEIVDWQVVNRRLHD